MPCKIFSSVLFPSLQLQYDDKFTGFLFVNILKNRLKELVEEKVCYISTGKIKSSDLLRWKKINSTNLVHLLKTMHSWWMCFKLKFFIEQYPIQGKVLKMHFQKMMQKSRMRLCGRHGSSDLWNAVQWTVEETFVQTFAPHPMYWIRNSGRGGSAICVWKGPTGDQDAQSTTWTIKLVQPSNLFMFLVSLKI